MREVFVAIGSDIELVATLEAEGNIISFTAPISVANKLSVVVEIEIVSEAVGVVSLVTHTPADCAHRLASLFARDIIAVNMASPLAVSIVVPEERVGAIVRQVHEEFLERK